MICLVEECPELAENRGLCALHFRRFQGGYVTIPEDGSPVYDVCAKGHRMTPDNIRWESSGKKGQKRRRCKECLRLKAQRAARKDKHDIPKPYRPDDLTLTRAIADFEDAKMQVDGKCKGNPGPWMDWDETNIPTRAEAEALCEGCPLIKACPNYAYAAQETHGVWGGKRIHEGVWLDSPRVRTT